VVIRSTAHIDALTLTEAPARIRPCPCLPAEPPSHGLEALTARCLGIPLHASCSVTNGCASCMVSSDEISQSTTSGHYHVMRSHFFNLVATCRPFNRLLYKLLFGAVAEEHRTAGHEVDTGHAAARSSSLVAQGACGRPMSPASRRVLAICCILCICHIPAASVLRVREACTPMDEMAPISCHLMPSQGPASTRQGTR
jgi:hypothetical protein